MNRRNEIRRATERPQILFALMENTTAYARRGGASHNCDPSYTFRYSYLLRFLLCSICYSITYTCTYRHIHVRAHTRRKIHTRTVYTHTHTNARAHTKTDTHTHRHTHKANVPCLKHNPGADSNGPCCVPLAINPNAVPLPLPLLLLSHPSISSARTF